MRLNPDCIRDVLLNIENVVTPSKQYMFPDDRDENLTHYTSEEIIYHMDQCFQSGLILGFKRYIHGSGASVQDLTPNGHEFLADIRSNTVWEKTKSKASSLGVTSLRALKDIAVQVIAELIKGSF
ncbi:DUF2513 domain-containing protein [Eubacteriales bacterium OttesenSCG-928-K08]|nr:DUF2513 domain-containing protein [Eubacteriales bacterium OttesenSCG-928-K08]